ncbi:MAG: response regulator transcription factor [Bacteroidetes bacterium]|nr:response regulator transcription factor [Bacteroidota bacterium]
MDPLKAVIIDDEPGSRNNLRLLLQSYCPDVKVLGMGEDVISGLKAIQDHQPNLIFLDIEMPENDGFKLVELLGDQQDTYVIFTTAYAKYAIQAIRVAAVDYLLKPISISELEKAVQRVKDLRCGKKDQSAPPSGRIAISHQDGYSFVEPNKIILLQADRSYTIIYLEDKKKLIVARSLSDFEEILKKNRFFRSHRSYLINLEQVREYVRKDGGYLVMSNGEKVVLSRKKKEEFLQLYNML